jgi:kynureninase
MTPREAERRCGIVTLEADRPQEVERALLADGAAVDS